MPSRGTTRKDDDLVPKVDKIEPLPQGSKKPPLPTPGLLPRWNPLPIENEIDQGQPNLPPGIDNTRSIDLFRLFFTNTWLENIVEFTNTDAENILRRQEQNTPHQRPWHPMTKEELYAYLAGVIHMGIHKEPQIEQYWSTTSGVYHRIRDYISAERWQLTFRLQLVAQYKRPQLLIGQSNTAQFAAHIKISLSLTVLYMNEVRCGRMAMRRHV